MSRIRVSASFQIISCLLGRLGSVVRVSVSFQSFALRMFVTLFVFLPSRLLYRVSERSVFCPTCPVSCHVLGDPTIVPLCHYALLRVFYGPLWVQLQISYTVVHQLIKSVASKSVASTSILVAQCNRLCYTDSNSVLSKTQHRAWATSI